MKKGIVALMLAAVMLISGTAFAQSKSSTRLRDQDRSMIRSKTQDQTRTKDQIQTRDRLKTQDRDQLRSKSGSPKSGR